MLSTPAPFPHQGADALVERAGRKVAVRILQAADADGLVTITGGPAGASGTSRVPLAELFDPTPLTAAEEAEYGRLDRELAGQARPNKAKRERMEALRLRSIHADIQARLTRRAA